MKIFDNGIPAALYAIASFYLLPNPPTKGFEPSGNSFFIANSILAFT